MLFYVVLWCKEIDLRRNCNLMDCQQLINKNHEKCDGTYAVWYKKNKKTPEMCVFIPTEFKSTLKHWMQTVMSLKCCYYLFSNLHMGLQTTLLQSLTNTSRTQYQTFEQFRSTLRQVQHVVALSCSASSNTCVISRGGSMLPFLWHNEDEGRGGTWVEAWWAKLVCLVAGGHETLCWKDDLAWVGPHKRTNHPIHTRCRVAPFQSDMMNFTTMMKWRWMQGWKILLELFFLLNAKRTAEIYANSNSGLDDNSFNFLSILYDFELFQVFNTIILQGTRLNKL